MNTARWSTSSRLFCRVWLLPAPAVLCGLLLAGCGDAQPPAMETGAASPALPATAEPGDEIAVALAKLSPEDRLLAEKQKDCPVGGPLGSMDVPHKMMLGDRAIFLCCEGCEAEVKAHPEKYLAWLDERMGTSTATPAPVDSGESAATPPVESSTDEAAPASGSNETPIPAETAPEGT